MVMCLLCALDPLSLGRRSDRGISQLPDWLSGLVRVCGHGGRCDDSGCGFNKDTRANNDGEGFRDGYKHRSVGVDDNVGGCKESSRAGHQRRQSVGGVAEVGVEVWLVALETLLTLLEMATGVSQTPPPPLLSLLPSPHLAAAVASSSALWPELCLLPLHVARKAIFTHSFVQVKGLPNQSCT